MTALEALLLPSAAETIELAPLLWHQLSGTAWRQTLAGTWLWQSLHTCTTVCGNRCWGPTCQGSCCSMRYICIQGHIQPYCTLLRPHLALLCHFGLLSAGCSSRGMGGR
jgi:hypothetical protein